MSFGQSYRSGRRSVGQPGRACQYYGHIVSAIRHSLSRYMFAWYDKYMQCKCNMRSLVWKLRLTHWWAAAISECAYGHHCIASGNHLFSSAFLNANSIDFEWFSRVGLKHQFYAQLLRKGWRIRGFQTDWYTLANSWKTIWAILGLVNSLKMPSALMYVIIHRISY